MLVSIHLKADNGDGSLSDLALNGIFLLFYSFNQLCLPTYDSYEEVHKMLQLAISEGCEGFGMLWFPLPRRPFNLLALRGKTQVQSSACSPSLHLGSGGRAKTPCKGICHPEGVVWPFCIPNMSSRAHLFPFPRSPLGSMWNSKRTGAFVKEILHLISMHPVHPSFCEKMKFINRSYI